MSTITTIQSSDLITNSRADINTNFANLNADKIETSVIDTDTALTANSDAKIPSQKAVKAYVDAGGNVNASDTVKGIVEEATDAEALAGTAVGATGARLFVNPTSLQTVVDTEINAILAKAQVSTAFETSARFTSIASGGTNTFDTRGLYMDTTVTSGRVCGVRMAVLGAGANAFLGSPIYSCFIQPSVLDTTGNTYFGIGAVAFSGTGHIYTDDHAGFKILIAAGVASLYATQGDGTTETASSALTTLSAGDVVEVIMKMNGTSSIDYYYRKNGGAISSATNLTTNIPNTASNVLQVSTSNSNASSRQEFIVTGMSYTR